MEDTRPEEKRAMRRFMLQLPVTVTAKSGERLVATAESRDVSSHGICFYCDAALEPESKIEFTLTLPTEITMTEPLKVRCSGRVVRVENSSGSGKFAVAAAIDDYEFVADDADRAQPMHTEADAAPAV
ncbi:MAG: PilZ domain-containing protein [Candidatus Korobacteraceae bacterium]